ncbi:SNO glutamine amidotransferase, partial [Helicosporidium sp. ATCC 50920]
MMNKQWHCRKKTQRSAFSQAAARQQRVRIGVLALQGAFREHVSSLRRLEGVEAVEVRTHEELMSVDGLVIPGGESTTMALVAERWGLLDSLQAFSEEQRPIWGTCAGLIFLARRVSGAKKGGQRLLENLDCSVCRNFFGAQVNSFEAALEAPPALRAFALDGSEADAGAPSSETFPALFIRAPAILEAGPGVEVLARCPLPSHLASSADASAVPDSVIVAVRAPHLLATSFHPELTPDARWHALFASMVR